MSIRTMKQVIADLSDTPPIKCNFKIRDKVTFTNEYGIVFKDLIIIGFAKEIDPDFLPDRFVFLNTSSYWFPHSIDELTKA